MTEFDIMKAIGEADEDLLDSVLAESKPKSMRKTVKIALAAVIAAALLIGAAVAASSDGFLSELFGESYDIIGDYVMMEPISVENEYARLTVESALSDGFNAYVVYSVERLDGGTLEGMSLDMEVEEIYKLDYGRPQWSYSEPFETGNETPQKQWYIFRFGGELGLKGVKLRLLGARNFTTGERADFGEVKLELTFRQSPAKIGGYRAEPMGKDVYTDVALSPIGLRAKAYMNHNPLTTDGSGESQRVFDTNYDIACRAELIFKDGSRKDLSEMVSRRRGSVADDIRVIFTEPLDIDQVEAVEIEGVYIPLEYGEAKGLEMEWERGDGFFAMQREYVYGGKEPIYPAISAESDAVKTELESIWTDGSCVELFMYITNSEENTGNLNPMTYEYNGSMEIAAFDKNGEKLGIHGEFVMLGRLEDGRFLQGYIVRIGGKAETLRMNLNGAEMTIPLDMKKLKKMPQGEPYVEPAAEEPSAPENDIHTEIYQDHYDHIFGSRTPDKVDITADNGEYSITVDYLWQSVNKSTGKFLAMIRCEQLDGEYYEHKRVHRETEIGVVYEGEFRAATFVGGGFGLSWINGNVRCVASEIDYEFPPGERDTVRLIWTPPSGERIVLDIPVE